MAGSIAPSVGRLTPEDVGEMLLSRPITSSEALGWRGILLQRYQHPPGTIDLPPVRDHIVVVNLAGRTIVEDEVDGGQRERRWTDGGHMSLTPAGQSVSRVLKGRPDVLLIHLAPELVEEVAASVYGIDAGPVCLCPCLAVPDGTVDRLGRLLLSEAEAGDRGTAFAAGLLARSLAVHLLRCYSNAAARKNEPSPSPGGRLRRVIDHMHEHIDEDLPLDRLAGVSGLSQPQFARVFREATGEPPHRYLVGLRVKRACDLLERSELSVIEVGMRCGFEQPAHFATMFRKITGMSPRAWRTGHRS